MVTVAVLREEAPGERRVALVPESVGRLRRAGVNVVIAEGAGAGALIGDRAYADAGAEIRSDPTTLLSDADIVVGVRRPASGTLGRIPPGAVVIGLFQPSADELLEVIRERNLTALALEKVPRITRAQSMDVLSSQSTVSGYLAVLMGAARMTKFMPMLTTAAGAIPPAKAFIIGAGVAGLQAIATARRLGAIVSGFDIRPAAAEQVKSLGASFVAAEALASDAETSGGYAKAQSEAEQERTMRALAAHIPDMDLVITTALIPGRPAPRLITEEMLVSMRPGSVVVDLAAEAGGNCAQTIAGEECVVGGVTVLGPLNLPSTLPLHASQMFSRNVLTLLQHLIRDGELALNREDEIVGPMLVAAPAAAAS